MYVVLTTDLSFTSVCGKDLTLLPGTSVYVDLKTMVAWVEGVHFDIECADFTHSH